MNIQVGQNFQFIKLLPNTFIAYIVIVMLATAFPCGFGCAISKPTPDPLAGFYVDAFHTSDSNKVIADDYKEYIRKLSLKKEDFIGSVDFLENRDGQHAVAIKIGINGTWWEH